MANRDNHYEAAFEAYLRSRGVPYIAVDEAKRSLLSDGASIKSLDFIVSSPGPTRWLVDVKGRKFPSGDIQKQYWKNWSTRDDLVSLAQWERLFGQGFCGLFVFAYNILGDRAPLPYEQLFEFRDKLYAFVAVRLMDYAGHARPISAKWDTLAMPAADFRRLARPLDELLGLGEKRAEVRGQGSEVGGQRSEAGDQRPEVGDQRPEGGDQRPEVRGQGSEVSGRRSEVGDQSPEVGDQP